MALSVNVSPVCFASCPDLTSSSRISMRFSKSAQQSCLFTYDIVSLVSKKAPTTILSHPSSHSSFSFLYHRAHSFHALHSICLFLPCSASFVVLFLHSCSLSLSATWSLFAWRTRAAAFALWIRAAIVLLPLCRQTRRLFSFRSPSPPFSCRLCCARAHQFGMLFQVFSLSFFLPSQMSPVLSFFSHPLLFFFLKLFFSVSNLTFTPSFNCRPCCALL